MHNDFTDNVLGSGKAGLKSASLLLAGVPGTPSALPTRGVDSSSSVIDVVIQSVAETNGAAILSYNIEIDDGRGGDFVELQGESVHTLSLSGKKSTGVV